MIRGEVHNLARVNVLVALLVLALKTLGWFFSGSLALGADALESVINVAAAGAALLALRWAHQPPDDEHPFGHGKAEYLSAVAEGVLIVLAAGLIAKEALPALLSAFGGNPAPTPLEEMGWGLGFNLVATVINALWMNKLIRTGKAHHSPALVADGEHLRSDVISSVGVWGGVILAHLTGIGLLDPLLALLVAVNVLFSGWGLMKNSLGGLMDAAPPPETQKTVRACVAAHATGALEAHDLRMRQSGPVVFVEFHLVVPDQMTVAEAHGICDRLEEALENAVSGAKTTIHLEPATHAKHSGVLVI